MKKIIALNWKKTQNLESGKRLWEVLRDISHSSSSDFEYILFPGDHIINLLEKTPIILGYQDFSKEYSFPYTLIGHMEQRENGETEKDIVEKINKIALTLVTPILCVWPLHPEDEISTILEVQLQVIRDFPSEKKIVIAYEPKKSIGNGLGASIDEIQKAYELIKKYTPHLKDRAIIYGGSVDHNNIGDILSITDGVIIGTASQNAESLEKIFLSLNNHLWNQK